MLNRLRSSLGAKITLILLIVLVVLLGIAWFFARQNAEKEMTDHYRDLARVVSSFSYDVVSSYIEDPNANIDKMEMLGNEINDLCKDELIDMVFIATEDKDNSTVGDILMIVLNDSVEIKGVNQYSGTYDFDSEELEIMSGSKDEATIIYNARIGEVVSFIYGYDIVNEQTGEKTRIIVGSNVTVDIFNSSIGKIMLNLFFGMFLLIILVIIIIRIIIYETAIVPFRVLSESMKQFIQNNKMNFEPLKVKGFDERASVVEAFNIMGQDIQSYIESVNKLEGERQKNLAEIEVASEIQKGLLPESDYVDSPFTLKGCMLPAQNVGGDLYYYHRLDEHRIAFALGDVSGKGISAALFMASTMGAIKYNLRECISPANALAAINNDIISHNPNRLFVTLFVGILDAKEHTLTYSNAGHNSPYIIGEKLEPLTDGKGIFAGVFADEEYEDAVVEFNENNQLFLYTDGVTEAVNAQKEFFGEERLENLLTSSNDGLIDDVLSQVHHFIQEVEQYDDITMMTISFKEKSKHK